MAGKSVSSIYRRSERRLLKHLEEAGSLEPERLHKMRVDIKNLRVLLDILRVVTGQKKAGQGVSRVLDPVFRKAGRVRTITLNVSLSRPYRTRWLEKFRQHLRNTEEIANRSFLQSLENFDHKRFREKSRSVCGALKDLGRRKTLRAMEAYLRTLLAGVGAAIFDIGDDEILHDIRKRLRAIRNITNVLAGIDPEFLLREEIDKLDAVYNRIGKWHDTQELIVSLENFVDAQDDPSALGRTAPVIIALKKKCLAEKQQIGAELRALLLLKQPAAAAS